jgi:hypothetical protein
LAFPFLFSSTTTEYSTRWVSAFATVMAYWSLAMGAFAYEARHVVAWDWRIVDCEWFGVF